MSVALATVAVTAAVAVTVAVGGVLAAIGGLARWRLAAENRPGLPVGTFGVNVVASFAAGLLASVSTTASIVVVTALLGSLSTFSTFVAEVVDLRATHGRSRSVLYAVATCTAGVGAAWLGLALGG